MRLTLRTLLAFRDQVLEPKDAEILEQRFRESQTAQNLSQRINHLLANPVDTPLAVDAVEFGLNPNDVSSFLDDAMPHDRIADMERKCLDNQALLAEVASCHQILVKTIRSPAPVSVGFRNRVLGLCNGGQRAGQTRLSREDDRRRRADAPHLQANSPFGVSGDRPQLESIPPRSHPEIRFGTYATPQPRKREIPDYLQRTDRQWIGSILKLVILLALLAVCVTQSLGSKESLSQLLDRQPNDWSSMPKVKPSPVPSERSEPQSADTDQAESP